MERRILGRTGLSVSVLGIGAAQLGAFGLSDEAECLRVAHQCFDAGVNLIDTADFYSLGKSEKLVGKVIADRRDKIILATKCGMPLSEDPNERGGSRRWIMTAADRSLKRLNTDYIDIYQLHAPDPHTEIEETIGAMNDLVKAGKIRYFGTSNFTGQLCSEAQLRAKIAGFTPPHTEQSAYSIFHRGPETELLPADYKYGVGFLAYSPLDGGWLSGKYRKAREIEKSPRQKIQPGKFDLSDTANADKLERVEKLAALADQAGMDLGHLAIGFVLAHKAVSCALVGGSRADHFTAHLTGDTILSDDILDEIDRIAPPGANLPEDSFGGLWGMDKELRRKKRSAPTAAELEATRRMLALMKRHND